MKVIKLFGVEVEVFMLTGAFYYFLHPIYIHEGTVNNRNTYLYGFIYLRMAHSMHSMSMFMLTDWVEPYSTIGKSVKLSKNVLLHITTKTTWLRLKEKVHPTDTDQDGLCRAVTMSCHFCLCFCQQLALFTFLFNWSQSFEINYKKWWCFFSPSFHWECKHKGNCDRRATILEISTQEV